MIPDIRMLPKEPRCSDDDIVALKKTAVWQTIQDYLYSRSLLHKRDLTETLTTPDGIPVSMEMQTIRDAELRGRCQELNYLYGLLDLIEMEIKQKAQEKIEEEKGNEDGR